MSDYIAASNAPAQEGTGMTSEGRYETLSPYRNPYLTRAWDCGELTLPSLLPRGGHNSTTILPTPFQNVGARGVNHLSTKLWISLFPPNVPFFKMLMDEMLINQLEQEKGEEEAKNLKTEFDKAFSTIERMVMADIEATADRVALFEALQHVIVAGNVLLHFAKEGIRVFHLDQFVVRRDPAGHVLEIILKEEVDPVILPQVIAEKFKNSPKYGGKKTACLYTHIIRRETKWEVIQEAVGEKIEKTRGSYELDKCPWLTLRMKRINGEDYGRGYVEDYIGDLMSLENLTAAIVQGSAAAAKVLFLVKPNSMTKPKVLAQTGNGGFAVGNAEDVTVLRLDKAQDFATAKELRDDFITQLSYAFLMNTAIQRQAERVTAEEIRFMAQELEQALGGFYSIMSVELQLPYVKIKMDALQRQGKLPKLPKGAVRPSIVTGIEALGRGLDRTKLVQFVQTIFTALTPQIAIKYINPSEVIARLAISDGIDTKNLIFTQAEVAEQDQQAQRMAMLQSLGPNAVNAAGGMGKEMIKGQHAMGSGASVDAGGVAATQPEPIKK